MLVYFRDMQFMVEFVGKVSGMLGCIVSQLNIIRGFIIMNEISNHGRTILVHLLKSG